MATIRAFIAVDLSEEARQSLEGFSDQLRQRVPSRSVRWVNPNNIHLTLSFLGDTPADLIPNLVGVMDDVTRQYEPFELHLGKLGCFPKPRRPRVVWVGVAGHVERLANLQLTLTENLRSLGQTPERRKFHPHLTLARVKNSHEVVGSRLPWGDEASSATLVVDSLKLFESKLRPSGAIYSVIHSSPLTTRVSQTSADGGPR